MGYPTMIYLSDENREKLKGEENRSSLINDLLNAHFDMEQKPKEEKPLLDRLDDAAAKAKRELETERLRKAILEEVENGRD